jgi:hypothetical protein
MELAYARSATPLHHSCNMVLFIFLTYILLTYRNQGEREGGYGRRKARLNLRTFSRVAPAAAWAVRFYLQHFDLINMSV